MIAIRVLAVAILAVAFVTGPVVAGDASGVIRFTRTSQDFGSLLQGQQATDLFDFTNDGGADLRIFGVEPSCGCTSVLLTANVIPPGGSGSIRVSFDSSNFTGYVTKEISVNSSDPERPTIILMIRAQVEPEVEFEPRQVVFSGIRPGVVQRETVALTNRRNEPVEVRALEVSPGSFRCRLPAWSDPSRPLVMESWDRLEIEIMMTPPPTVAMPIPGECVLTIHGPIKTRFTLKLLGLPSY